MGRVQLPIRIYTLAKELKIDNKKLVDICTKAGIKGKGSALASLTDEELATLKAFMAGGRGGPAAEAAASPARGRAGGPQPPRPAQGFRREDYLAPGGAPSAAKCPSCAPRRRSRAAKKKPAEDGAAKAAEKEREGAGHEAGRRCRSRRPAAGRRRSPKEPAPQKPDIKLPAGRDSRQPRREQAAFRAPPQARGEEGEG